MSSRSRSQPAHRDWPAGLDGRIRSDWMRPDMDRDLERMEGYEIGSHRPLDHCDRPMDHIHRLTPPDLHRLVEVPQPMRTVYTRGWAPSYREEPPPTVYSVELCDPPRGRLPQVRPRAEEGTAREGDMTTAEAMLDSQKQLTEQLVRLVTRLEAGANRNGDAEIDREISKETEVTGSSGEVNNIDLAVKDKHGITGTSDGSSHQTGGEWTADRRRKRQVSVHSSGSTGEKLASIFSERRQEVIDKYHGHDGIYKVAWYAECITCGIFCCACALMLALWIRHENEASFVTTFFVTGIASMTYYAKACHMGDVMLLGHSVPIARYIDWVTTTPLMLYELCHLAHAETSQTLWIIGCDLGMLITGIIAAMIPWDPHKWKKQVWFFASCMYYTLMVSSIQVDVAYKAKKQSEAVQTLFQRLELLTIIVWTFYPIVVGLGRAHLGIMTKPMEDTILCVLDVVSKVGMEGFIVVSCLSGCISNDYAGGH
jgi:bacteriorhodopsin